MSKKTYFTKVDNEIIRNLELTPNQKMTYITILSHTNWNTYRCTIGMATIALETGCSKRTTQRCINVLVNKGLLKRIHNRNEKLNEWKCNTYIVNHNPSVPFKINENEDKKTKESESMSIEENENISLGMDKVTNKLELSKDIDSDMIETNIKKIEKVQIEEKQLSSKEIISKLKETFENKIVNKALSQFKKVAKSKIVNNLYAYLKAICENIKVQFELYEIAKDVKVEEQKEQSTYKKSKSTNNQSNFTYNNNQYKNKFHNLCESRTDKYTADELENIVRDNFEFNNFDIENIKSMKNIEEIERVQVENREDIEEEKSVLGYLNIDINNYLINNIYSKMTKDAINKLNENDEKYLALCKAIKKILDRKNLVMNY